ncbi:DUF748 domain-containing protein [Candidatus Cloacimonadota bacterium]
MRKKKWLLVIVALLFLINIAFYGVVRWGKADQIVKNKVENYLKEYLKADILIEDFSFNDKQLNLNGFHVKSTAGNYTLDIRQIYIEYDLPMLLFSNFTNYKAIEEIKIFEPEFVLKITESEGNGDSEASIPDIARYFKHLTIYNGRAEISYDGELVSASTIIDTLNLTLENTSRSEIDFEISNRNNSGGKGKIILYKGELSSVDLNLNNLSPAYLKVEGIDQLGFKADIDLLKQMKTLSVTGSVNDLVFSAAGRYLQAGSLPFTVNDNELNLFLKNCTLDGSNVTGYGKFIDFLKSEKFLSANVSVQDIPLGNYIDEINGKADLQIELSGTSKSPIIRLDVSSDQLDVYGQQLNNISLNGIYENDSLKMALNKMEYRGNTVTGSGSYMGSTGLNASFISRDFFWDSSDFVLEGDLRANIFLQDELEITFNLQDLLLKYGIYELDEFSLHGSLLGDNIQAELARKRSDLKMNIAGDLKKRDLTAKLDFSRFDLSHIIKNNALPLISGSFEIIADTNRVRTYSSMRIFDRNYASLNGRIIFDSFLDLNTNALRTSLRTSKARYNFEPFSLNIFAEGSLDSLHIKRFDLNKEIFVTGHAVFGKERSVDLNLNFDSLDLRKYLKYFTDYNFYSLVEGEASLDLSYNTDLEKPLTGSLRIDDFSYDRIRDLSVTSELEGSLSSFRSGSSLFLKKNKKLFDLNSVVSLVPDFSYYLTSSIKGLDIAQLFPENEISGIVDAELEFCHDCGDKTLDLKADITELDLQWLSADTVIVDLNQKSDLLDLRMIKISKADSYSLYASGKLGYNLLDHNIFPDTNKVYLRFDGDIFNMLSANSSIITDATSDCLLDLMIGVEENGLSIKQGSMNLRKGSLKFVTQMETVDKIKVDLEIEDNKLNISRFTGRVGLGNFFLENLIEGTEDEFILGNLQLGKFYFYTDETGLNIHMPYYMPGNSVATTVVKGRNSDKLSITGPFDDILIQGDLYLSNGSAIYPPNTENLVKLLSKLTEEKDSKNYDIPLRLDLVLHLGENTRYVTYPLNLLVDPGSYMNLKFDNDKFSVTDAYFISESGYIDIFGTQMLADYITVKISPYEKKININGVFYQQASDGTMLTLHVNSLMAEQSTKVFALDFDLRSDDPNDSRTDILALLRYGRRQEEISPDQRRTILQDEVIQLAGLGIESAVIDPVISPVETWVRRMLRLDFFHLQTDLIQNIFNRYSSDRTDYVVDEEGEKLWQNTGDLFLNNLSIGMGKYLSRKVFLDYELEFQKPQDLSVKSDMGIYHNISVRYDLPYRLKLVYKFHILPFDEKNTHEISLEKSIRF